VNQNRLLRNSVVLAGGVIVGGLLLFTTLVIIARYLTVQRFGQFSIAVTLAAVFQLFADGGIAYATWLAIRRAAPACSDRHFCLPGA
jgi:O-antigen/teichoic acid export membrane protein